LSAETIFIEVREAALRLLRGQHVDVVLLEGLTAEQIPPHLPASLIQLAQIEGHAVVLDDELSDTAQVARSALCVPIFVRGRAAACLCVTHDEIRRLFGDNETRLADFIATLAGAALENAEGFQQL